VQPCNSNRVNTAPPVRVSGALCSLLRKQRLIELSAPIVVAYRLHCSDEAHSAAMALSPVQYAVLSCCLTLLGSAQAQAPAATVSQGVMPATTSSSKPSGAVPAISASALRAHAEFLSSDLLEGRATGSRGFDLAAAYVAAQFLQSGLTPAGDEGTYLQAVPLVEATVVLPGSSAVLRRGDGSIEFDFGKDYLPSANFFNANTTVSAPLAFAGFGIEAPEFKYNDLAEVDLEGKIAVVLEGAPARLNDDARTYYSWPEAKYSALSKAGAVGVIEIHRDSRDGNGTRGEHLGWERATAMSWVSHMRHVDADNQPGERYPGLKLRFRFNESAAARLFNNGHSFEQVLQAAQAGEPQGFNLPGTMTLTATTGLRRIESNNVLGMVRGSDPVLRNEYVLVTAHLDGLGRGAAVNGDSIYNGLQRNAAGVAMLLEVARAMAMNPVRPKRSILFAAVTAGEKDAQGLTALLSTRRNIVAGITIDTPLPLARTTDVVAVGANQSSVGTQLASAAQQLDLRVLLGDVNTGYLLMDSLAPMVRAGIPALAVRAGTRLRSGRSNFATLRRSALEQHVDQPSDDWDNAPLEMAAARELTQLSAATVMQLVNAERPVWYRSSLVYRKLTRGQ